MPEQFSTAPTGDATRTAAALTVAEVLAQNPDLPAVERAALIHLDQLRSGRAGLPPYFEAEFGGEMVLDLIGQEVLLRQARGERPTLEEYLARYPALAERLAQRLPPLLADPPSAEPVTVAFASTISVAGPVQLPGYEVLAEVGRGAMGVVYKARQLGLKRIVAVKMLLPGAAAGPTELARFRAEAEAVAALAHPNIVPIYQVGEADGQAFFAMEYLEGGSLAERTIGQALPPRDAAELVETLARAIHHAHLAGIVHRDLKPANILLATDEHGSTQMNSGGDAADASIRVHPCSSVANSLPKITDFGLAKRVDQQASLTPTGAIVGTPSYMAPEQARGEDVGPAADVWALGAILYELLTGQPPFLAATPLDTMLLVMGAEPLPPRRLQPGAPPDLETICLKCLTKDPARRYGTAQDLADDLRRFLQGELIQARPSREWELAWHWLKKRSRSYENIAGVLAMVGFFGIILASVMSLGQNASATFKPVDPALINAPRPQRTTTEIVVAVFAGFVAYGSVLALVIRPRRWAAAVAATLGLVTGAWQLAVSTEPHLVLLLTAWAMGTAAGLLVSVPCTLLARQLQSDRADAILAATFGAFAAAVLVSFCTSLPLFDRPPLFGQEGPAILRPFGTLPALVSIPLGFLIGAVVGALRSPRRREWLRAVAARQQHLRSRS